MTTRTTFVAKTRARLNDPDLTKWSDAEIESYLEESVAKYSKLFPRVREQEFLGDGESSRFNVPSDLLDNNISRMWLIKGDEMMEVSGGVIPMRVPERRFEVVGQELVLNFIPTTEETVRIRYNATYPFPVSDDTLVPVEDDDIIIAWALHLAWIKIAGKDVSLSRFKEEGKRDDSPVIPHYRVLEQEWQRMVNEKKDRGRVLTRVRAGRYGRYYYNDSRTWGG